MININRVVLVGRLTRDVEVRKTGSGLSVASFTVAVSRRFARQDAQNNNQPTADFISCVAWRQAADFLGNYGKKGTLIGVEGRLQTRSYDGNDGRKGYVTEVVCDNVQLQNNGTYQDAASTGMALSSAEYRQKKAEASTEFQDDPLNQQINDDLPF